ncbi:MAG: hypothetical protein ACKOWX_08205 [Flavobacteriales bacterium]
MKNKIGLILLVCLNGATLVLYYALALVSFGIIVMGTFSIERSNEVVREILTLYAWFGMLSVLVNYFILKYLNGITRPVLWAIAISLFCLLVSSSFIYIEREKFLDNGRWLASLNEKSESFISNYNLQLEKLDSNYIKENFKFRGKVKDALRFTDKQGTHIVFTCENFTILIFTKTQ